MGDGVVYATYTSPTGHSYGLHIRVQHESGLKTLYCHLDQINVSVGQQVTAGQVIGLSGNTGNSTGPHLHLALKKDGVTYIDQNGNLWPSNFINLWPYIKHLYRPPNRQFMTGFVYDYIIEGSDGEGVNFSGNLNLRTSPDGNAAILGSVPSLSMIEITGAKTVGYYPVGAWAIPTNTPTPPTYQYNGPAVTFSPALHGPASDYEWQKPELKNMLNTLNMPMKFMSNGINSDYYTQYKKPALDLVRVFWKPDRYKSPQEAWNDDIRDGVLRFYNLGARDFEVLNEPNLPSEGAYLVWNENDFGDWLRELCLIIRSNCPGVRLWFPGMSPGVPWTVQFTWTNKAWPKVKDLMSGFALHAYSGITDNATNAINDIVNQVKESQSYLNLQVPLIVSESSVNRAATAVYKAQVYKGVETQLKSVAGVKGVVWYVSSWEQVPPEQDNHQEDWLKWGIWQPYNQQ